MASGEHRTKRRGEIAILPAWPADDFDTAARFTWGMRLNARR